MGMLKTHNRKVKYQNKQYEIIWISDFALHVMKRYNEPSHMIDHLEIEKLVIDSFIIPYKENYHLDIGKFRGKYYQAVVHFSEKTKRCIVKTCYCVYDSRILQICKDIIS